MRISDWSSDVCSSDLIRKAEGGGRRMPGRRTAGADGRDVDRLPAQLRKGQARRDIAARPDEAGDGAGATFSRRRARGATIAENEIGEASGRERGSPYG